MHNEMKIEQLVRAKTGIVFSVCVTDQQIQLRVTGNIPIVSYWSFYPGEATKFGGPSQPDQSMRLIRSCTLKLDKLMDCSS